MTRVRDLVAAAVLAAPLAFAAAPILWDRAPAPLPEAPADLRGALPAETSSGGAPAIAPPPAEPPRPSGQPQIGCEPAVSPLADRELASRMKLCLA